MLNQVSSVALLFGKRYRPGAARPAWSALPTKVLAEEPEPVVIRVARASGEEPEPQPRKQETKAPEEAAFHFPDDRGGELLRKELTPVRPLPEPTVRHVRRQAARGLHPRAPWSVLPLPSSLVGQPVLLPERARKPLLPRLVTPETLVGLALGLALPQAKPMPVGERIKEKGADVNQPAPLPLLGQPLPDRAALTDATGDASGAAVVAATMPVRQQTVPFQRQGVPDPYEMYRPLRLPLPEESTAPVSAAPRTPLKP